MRTNKFTTAILFSLIFCTAYLSSIRPLRANPPVLMVSPTPAMTSVYRIGVNLGNQSQYSDADFMQNMFDNPGFEEGVEGHIIIVASPSPGAFQDSSDNGERTGFWVGSKAAVRTGTDAGATLTISGFTSGGSYTYSSCSPTCSGLAAGDAIAELQTGTLVGSNSQAVGGWALSDTNVTVSTASPYEGNASLAFNVSDGNSHNASFTYDTFLSTGGVCSSDNVTPCTTANAAADCGTGISCNTAPEAGPWHSVLGAYEIALFAKAVNTSQGTPQVTVSLERSGGTNVNHTFTLINDGNYHQYVYTFTGTDTAASAQNQMVFGLSVANTPAEPSATIYVDDVYLGRDEPSATGFRDEVVDTLKAINPGSLRYMIPNTLDQDDANYEGLQTVSSCTPGAVGISGYQSGGCDYLKGPSTMVTGVNNYRQWGWYYASQDVYALANAVNAVPWFSIPNSFSDADLRAFIVNACKAINTYNFRSVWIEQSNEDWNASTPSGDTRFGGSGSMSYGKLAGRNFSVMSTEASSVCPSIASRIHYIAGNQTCNNGVLTKVISGAVAQGYPIPNSSQYGSDDAGYDAGGTNGSGDLPDFAGSLGSQAAQYAAWFLEYPAEVLFSPGTCISSDKTALAGANNFLAIYETGAGAVNGPGSTEQSYLSQAGFPSAAWMATTWILGQQALLPLQDTFTLSQAEFGGNPANPIWGIDHDLDSDFPTSGYGFPHLRPIALGQELVNTAIAGNYFPIDTSQTTGIYGNAYEDGGNWRAALVNSTASSEQVQVDFPATGIAPSVGNTILYTNGIMDNNENSAKVSIGALPGGLSVSGQDVTATLPADSVVVLGQPGSIPTPTPAATPTPMSTGGTPTSTPGGSPIPPAPPQTPTPMPTPTHPPAAPKVPAVVTISQSSVSFGSVKVRKRKQKLVTLTNSAKKKGGATVIFGGGSISGSSEFFFSTNCNGLIGPGKKCSVQIGFGPSTPEAAGATITIESNASNSPHVIGVMGTGK